jgi:hypothetical protein
MPPTPTPLPEQVEVTRECARLLSFSYTQSLVDKLIDEQWVRQLETNADWELARHDDVKVLGRVLIEPAKTREFLTNETRERLGLPPYIEGVTNIGAFGVTDPTASGSTPTRVEW